MSQICSQLLDDLQGMMADMFWKGNRKLLNELTGVFFHVRKLVGKGFSQGDLDVVQNGAEFSCKEG
jgi:hypothetical protein